MIDHFNAFISYKHAPEDNMVADAVHKGLEHFRIPGKIRKKYGIKKINRIFRDKAELPITSDLGDNISYALKNSDYLIVLCSTNTKESAWVPREIEAFLENHSKRDVFTVLVNGEPRDVIPEILQYEERTLTAEDGSEQTVKMPIEPLSCDYRMPFRKAKKEELPRLASGLIGCAYDEIMNRQRQYRLKRLTAIFSIAFAVVLGFAGYMFYSRTQIHKNYLESLKNQSKYLANESGKLLEKAQRIPALQLALEALPKSDGDDRPITAEAVKALTDATLAYESNNGVNIHAAWNYNMPNEVTDFKLTEDGKYIAILDKGSMVGLWDTQTHDQIMYLDDAGSGVRGIGFANNDSLITWTDTKVCCYDSNSGKMRWEYTLNEDSINQKIDLIIAEKSFYINTEKNRFIEFDIASGKVLSELMADTGEGVSVVEGKLSKDHKKIAFRGLKGRDSYAYGVIDITTKKTTVSDVVSEYIKDIEWADNDTFLIAAAKVDITSSSSFGDKEIISTDHSKIRCIKAADLTEKWSSDFTCNGVNLNSGFFGLGSNNISYHSGNVVTVYDLITGQEKYSNNVNESVLNVSDRDGDGTPLYITEGGGYALPATSVRQDSSYYTKYFADNIRQVVVNKGVYLRQQYGDEVIYYGAGQYDKEWTPLGDDKFTDIRDDFICDESNVVFLSAETGKISLNIVSSDQNKKIVKVTLDGIDAYKYKLLGIYKDRVYLGYNNTDKYNLISCDLSGNDVKNDELFNLEVAFENTLTMKDGKLVYIYNNDNNENDNNELILAIRDTDSDDKTETVLPDDIGFIKAPPVYYADAGVVYIKGSEEYIFDIETKSFVKLKASDTWLEALCFSDNTFEGKFAVSDGKEIVIADKNGDVSTTIACSGLTPLGMTFLGEQIIVLYNDVLYNDGGLYRYDISSGEFIEKTDVFSYYNYDGSAIFDVDSKAKTMYIRTGKLTDVIDLENWAETAHLEQCLGHQKSRDIFITYSKEDTKHFKIGYYKHYTVEEIIDKAHEILKNSEISNEMKSEYGIEN